MTEPTLALEVRDLVKSYGAARVVDSISLNAASGAVTAILGPNGAGKTTTVECCEGLRTADGGTIRIFGRPPTDHALRAMVGVMLQDGGLPTGVPAAEMVRHVASLYDNPLDVDALLDRLGTESFSRTTVRRLSGGQRQRIALACAIVGRPRLVFLDEPSAGMDPQTRHAVWELVNELRADGVAVVLTTHLMDEAEALADHVVILDRGHILADGSVPDVLALARTEQVRWTTHTPLDLEAFSHVLGAALGTTSDGTGLVTTSGPAAYQITADLSLSLIEALARACAAQGALITSLDAGRATLEDVFLDLTGRSVR